MDPQDSARFRASLKQAREIDSFLSWANVATETMQWAMEK